MTTYQMIKRDRQIIKFCLYGFFKNLKFFEPYLLIYLISLGCDLFHIGILFSLRAATIYLFEVPSAIFADYYGKKKELLLCFVFYILSFILLFSGANYFIIILAMICFGLGEAFRSGTHKAMILSYLEQKDWYRHKAFVYGRTRSFSLLGSSLSAFISILFVLKFPVLRWVFALSTVPYIIDFILIYSYPDSLDERRRKHFNFRAFFKIGRAQLKQIIKDVNIVKIICSSASFDGAFKVIKDYIQPILSAMLVSSGIGLIAHFSQRESLKIYLGVIYGVFYFFSSFVSRNVFRLSNCFGSFKLFYGLYDLMGLVLIALSLTIEHHLLLLTILLYFVIYLLKDARKPLFVDVCSDFMRKSQRVTVLSVESQLRAILVMLFAPLFGYIAEVFSVSALFFILGTTLAVANRLIKADKKVNFM